MKIWKPLVAGLIVQVFNAIVGSVTCGGVFNWVYRLEPTNVWKPMDGPPGVTFYVGFLVLHIVLAFVYVLLKKGIPGPNRVIKGLVFGLCIWAVGTLPGMFATYLFMTVATQVVIYWTIMGLILSPIKGVIIAAICGK
ncbi:MAG: hypothetical protein SVT52_08730 [Planctomycetota bacterium]|nr:hypothetical protein [Planctomycetota bacterium]